MAKPMKIGIAADNYKLAKFKKELDKEYFTDYKITDLTQNESLISVIINPDRIKELKKLCENVEFHFKRGN